MKKFNFRLEPVLGYRKILEEQAALRQVKAQEEYRQNHDVLCETRDRLACAVMDNQVLSPFDMFNRLAYCDYMAGEVKKKETALNLSRRKLEKCHKNLVQAVRDRTVMDKLREKKLSHYNHAATTAEQKETDEVAGRQYNKNRKSS
ncbi:MAG: flagellar export protein FliJ [Firmicutes bacterium]|nr:flagellar export protein FliJ [Bacillota bacterium]